MATSIQIQIPRYNDVPSELEDFIEDLEAYFDAVGLSPTTNDVQCAAHCTSLSVGDNPTASKYVSKSSIKSSSSLGTSL